MLEALLEPKQQITSFLTNWLKEKQTNFVNINDISAESIKKITELSQKGKKIRGSIIIHTMHILGGQDNTAAIRAGAALELLHTGLLIHDDIMDKDNFRRGLPTISYQYSKTAPKGSHDATHYGNSLGICVSDMLYFFAFELLGTILHEKTSQIINKTGQELAMVAAAQMQDIHLSVTNNNITKKNILSVYKHKTARYTFSLPFSLGALLANASEATIDQLENLGEKLGILFQIKDDYIGMFGSKIAIGKPVGSDISENKKTLYWLYLMQEADNQEKSLLTQLFGAPLEQNSLKSVIDLIKKYQIQEKINLLSEKLKQEALLLIKNLNLQKENKKFLHELLKYNINRSK